MEDTDKDKGRHYNVETKLGQADSSDGKEKADATQLRRSNGQETENYQGEKVLLPRGNSTQRRLSNFYGEPNQAQEPYFITHGRLFGQNA